MCVLGICFLGLFLLQHLQAVFVCLFVCLFKASSFAFAFLFLIFNFSRFRCAPDRNERARKIQRLRWEIGCIIPDHIKIFMSTSEKDMFCKYDKILGDYMRAIGDLDLTSVKSFCFVLRVCVLWRF